MTVTSLPYQKDKLSVLAKNETEYWTASYLEDKLLLNLAAVRCEIKIIDNSSVTKYIHYKKYYRQALQKMYRICVWRPSPPFIIYISDLTDEVKSQLYDYYKTGYPRVLRYIVLQAVGRIFENIDFDYYHASIAHCLRVRFEK